MALKFTDGFGQFQGQVGSQLLSGLASAGYQASSGVVLAAGRHPDTYCLELQVSAGAGGLSWSNRVNGAKSNMRAVGYGNGRWVAVGENGVIYSSTDTLTWVASANTSSASLHAVHYSEGLWVAVGDGGTILTSSDGQNWTLRTSPSSTFNGRGVMRGDGRWIAVGAEGSAGGMLTSTDGITWGTIADAGAQVNRCVVYTGSRWVAGGDGGQVRYSDNGTTWSSGTFGSTTAILALLVDGANVIAAAGNTIRRSTDGALTWAQIGTTPTADTINALKSADGLYVAVCNTARIHTSLDLTSWTTRTSPFGASTPTLNGLAVTSGGTAAWVAVGNTYGGGLALMAAMAVSLAPPTTVSHTFESAAQRVVIGFAHRATSRGRIASIGGVALEWPAGVVINGVAGPAVPIRNTWYYYEVTIDKAANRLTLHINDTQDVVVEPLPAGLAALTSYEVVWSVENGAVGNLGDVYFLDSDTAGGATLTSRIGPIRIATRFPDANATVEWETMPVDGEHWEIVGLPPPDPDRYVYSSTSGAQELFTSDDGLPAGAGTVDMPIIAVAVSALATKTDLDARQLGLAVGTGGTQIEQIDDTLSVDPAYSQAVFEQAPGATAWTPANILSTPFGVIVRP